VGKIGSARPVKSSGSLSNLGAMQNEGYRYVFLIRTALFLVGVQVDLQGSTNY
jgi:hypothetical protein